MSEETDLVLLQDLLEERNGYEDTVMQLRHELFAARQQIAELEERLRQADDWVLRLCDIIWDVNWDSDNQAEYYGQVIHDAKAFLNPNTTQPTSSDIWSWSGRRKP